MTQLNPSIVIPEYPGKGIYRIYCISNNKSYIGQAYGRHGIRGRILGHIQALRSGRHSNPELLNAWNKYGECGFIIEILEKVSEYDRETLNNLEIHYVALYDSFKHGFNRTPGGDTTMYLTCSTGHTELTKEKIRRAITGLVRSEESKQRMRDSGVGKNLGVPKSEEHKQHIKESLSKSESFQKYMNSPRPKNSEEARQNKRIAALAYLSRVPKEERPPRKPRSEEARQKQRDRMKEVWARKKTNTTPPCGTDQYYSSSTDTSELTTLRETR